MIKTPIDPTEPAMNAIRVGNAPCSWGALEFEGLKGGQVAAPRMLAELAETGYVGTDLGDWGYMPTEPSALRDALAAHALDLVSAFVPVALRHAEAHAAGERHALKVARLLAAATDGSGHRPVVVLADDNGTEAVRTAHAGRITPAEGLNEASWDVFAAGATRIARAVREETGLPAVFHHHCAGYVETPEEIGTLLDRTDPALLGLVFDTGHLAFGAGEGGCDQVVGMLDRFGARVQLVHFKDCDPAVARRARDEGWSYFEAVRNGVFCELGRGCVDFAAMAAWLRAHHYAGWIVVEQDVLPGMGAPRESAARNRRYLRTLGL